MREILFRGKRVDNGEWVEGSLFVGDNGECEICYGTPRVRITYHVDPATIGQYTGLKDKNGMRIFEGDIVRVFFVDAEEVGEIVWNEEVFKFAFMSQDGCRYGIDSTVEFEIIGTVHDNPELLQKPQELEVL